VGRSLSSSRRIAKSAAQGCLAQDLAILREHWKTHPQFCAILGCLRIDRKGFVLHNMSAVALHRGHFPEKVISRHLVSPKSAAGKPFR
jgi:hypothetical protein